MNYQAMLERCAALITTTGKAVTITRLSGTFNAATQTVSSGTTSWTSYAVEDNYNSFNRMGNANAQGSSIQATDRRLFVAPSGSNTILPDDTIAVGGVTLRVVAVDAVRPGSTILLWEVQARG